MNILDVFKSSFLLLQPIVFMLLRDPAIVSDCPEPVDPVCLVRWHSMQLSQLYHLIYRCNLIIYIASFLSKSSRIRVLFPSKVSVTISS
jgi:hypothetical protein